MGDVRGIYPGVLARKLPENSGTKIQPKEEVFGRISLRTSGQKLRSGPPNPGKKQAFWNGHPARTSMKKLRSEKLRADFPFPKNRVFFLGGGGCVRMKRVPCVKLAFHSRKEHFWGPKRAISHYKNSDATNTVLGRHSLKT